MIRNQRRIFIYLLLFGMSFINYADRITMSIGGKRIAADLGLSNVQLGYLFSSFLWSYVICLLPAGVMTDRWGERKMAAAVISLWSAAQIVTGAATGFVTAVLSRLGLGIGECATNSVLSRAVREWAPASERGTAMALVLSGSYAGPAVGAALVGMLIEAIGWRMAFVLSGALGFIWLVVWLAFYRRPEATTWLSAQERERIISQREGGAEIAIPTPATILQLLKCPAMWGVALTQGGLGYNVYLFLTWLPTYLQTQKGLSLRDAGFYTAVCYGAAAIVSITLNFSVDRCLSAQSVVRGQRRNAVAFLIMLAALIDLTIPYAETIPLLIVLIGACLSCTAAAAAANFTLTSDLVTARQNVGRAIGILNIGATSFGLLAPIITGYVVDWTGRFDRTFLIAGILMLIGAVISLTTTRQPIGSSLNMRNVDLSTAPTDRHTSAP